MKGQEKHHSIQVGTRRRRLSRLATVGLAAGLAALAVNALDWFGLRGAVFPHYEATGAPLAIPIAACAILSTLALIRIAKRRERMTGQGVAIAGLIVAAVAVKACRPGACWPQRTTAIGALADWGDCGKANTWTRRRLCMRTGSRPASRSG